MKNYTITLQTIFGQLTIDNILAESEDDAYEKACEEAKKEIDCSKIAQVYLT